MNNNHFFGITCLLLLASSAFSQVPQSGSGLDAANFLPTRERVRIMETFWAWKRTNVLPMVMREQGIDLWIVRNDEEPLYRQTSYREHPVYTSLIPANHEGMTFSRQRKSLLLYDTGSEIEYFEPDDYDEIVRLVRERDPKRIALSAKNLYIRPQNFGETEQLSIVTSDEMQQALGAEYASRIVDSWHLGILWLSIIGPDQRSAYRYVQGVQNDVIAEAFSNRTVIPNITTIGDLNWWIRSRYRDLHLDSENHPSVSLKRRPSKVAEYHDSSEHFRNGRTNNEGTIIRRGDIIHLDSDIMLLGLETDSQQNAYVLQEGEEDVPEELKEALRLINEMLDRYRKAYVAGRTHEEILDAGNKMKPTDPRVTRARFFFHNLPMYMKRFTENGLKYSRGPYEAGIGSGYMQHPLYSPTLTLHYNTVYAHEPSFTVDLPEWGENGLSLGIEQGVVFTKKGCEFLNRANLEWHVIK